MNRLALALPLLLSASLAFAQDAADSTKTDKTDKPAIPTEAPVGLYQLKTKSSFTAPAGTRAPFVPIGWVKRAGPVAPGQKVDFDASSFQVTSVLLGKPSLAVINGRSYEEGQLLRMPRGGPQARILVYRIGDGKVVLQVDGKEVTVPLRRPELNERKVEETLLNEDRDLMPVVPKPKPPPPATPKLR